MAADDNWLDIQRKRDRVELERKYINRLGNYKFERKENGN